MDPSIRTARHGFDPDLLNSTVQKLIRDEAWKLAEESRGFCWEIPPHDAEKKGSQCPPNAQIIQLSGGFQIFNLFSPVLGEDFPI